MERDVNDQTRLDNNMADYVDMILSGRDAALPDDLAAEARMIQMLNRVIAPDKGMDAAMRSRMNQRLNEEWDRVQHRRKSRWNITSPYGRLAVAAGILIVVGVIAIIISTNDSSGSDVSATAQGDSSALVIVGIMAVGALVAGFLYFLWNRRP